jgi:hypothetical protein
MAPRTGRDLRSPRARRLTAALLAVALLVAPLRAAAQERGAQTSPDKNLLLINKDLENGERWAISLDPKTGIATGNVFPQGGGPPDFIWCRAKNVALAPDPRQTVYTFDCFGSDPCADIVCAGSPWGLILEDVVIQGSFFLPP